MGRALFSAAVCVALAAAAVAQDQTRSERQLERVAREQQALIDRAIPLDRQALFQYGAFVTATYLSLDDSAGGNRGLRQTEGVAYARLSTPNGQELFFRGRTGWQDFNAGDSFDGRGDALIEPDVDRLTYRLDLLRLLRDPSVPADDSLQLQFGRDLVYWGSGLTLGEVVDGVTGAWSSRTGTSVRFVAGVTPTRTVDLDPSRPNFDHNTRRGYYGVMLQQQLARHRPYVFALLQRDYNRDFRSFFPAADGTLVEARFEYNSYYLGIGCEGALGDRLLYTAELVYEGGETFSSNFDSQFNAIDQSRDDIAAWAGNIRIDYLPGDERNTRLSAELIVASGDSDRRQTNTTVSGNAPGSQDRAFNGLGFLNTGLALSPATSNLISVRAGLSTFPAPGSRYFERFQVGVDLFVFGKTDKDAPIDEPSEAGERYVGFEPDLFVNWQLAEDVTLAARYGVFFPGSAISDGGDDVRQFFSVSVTYAF